MPSKRRLAPVVGRDGINSGYPREQELSTVELDTTFGRLLGLTEGQKVYNTPRASLPTWGANTCRSDCSSTSIHPLHIR